MALRIVREVLPLFAPRRVFVLRHHAEPSPEVLALVLSPTRQEGLLLLAPEDGRGRAELDIALRARCARGPNERGRDGRHGRFELVRSVREVRRHGRLALNERERLREGLGHLGGRGRANAALGRRNGVGTRKVEGSDGGSVPGLGRGEGNGLPGWGKDLLRVVEGIRALRRVGAVQVLIIPEKPISYARFKVGNVDENDEKSKIER